MFTRCSFDKKENKLNYYRGKDCIEKLCKKLKESAMEIIDYKEKEMIPLTEKEDKLYIEQEKCHICEEKFCIDKDDKNYINRKKVKDHCHYTGKFRGAAHSKCNLNYKVPKEIPIIIHNASYDNNFILNQLAKEFKGELNCIGNNMEKYITFSVPLKQECDIKINSECCFVGLKNNKLIYKCKECKEECKRSINKLKAFQAYINFFNGNLNKFVILLRKGVYPYIWIVGKNLMKLYYHLKKIFIAI